MAVDWSERARDDLRAIFAHIAPDNRAAAELRISRIVECAELTGEAPLLGRIVPEVARDDVR